MLSPYHPLQLVLGLIIWITWFALIYGALAIACEIAPPPLEHGPFTWINAALLINSLIITALLLYWALVCWWAARDNNRQVNASGLFIAKLGAGINGVAAIATLSLGLMTMPLPPCL
jgi:hypothetical protein